MPSHSINLTTSKLQGNLPPRAQDLPHGLITPPEEVRNMIEQERAKHPPTAFAKAEERLVNEWTIAHYFDGLCLEVIYRPTPQGPEVLAVGSDEVFAFKKKTPLDELRKLKTFLGY